MEERPGLDLAAIIPGGASPGNAYNGTLSRPSRAGLSFGFPTASRPIVHLQDRLPFVKLASRFSDALAFAAELHGGQERKVSGVPYLAHLLAVAAIVLEHGGTEDEAIAALLHDAIEDQGGPAVREEIRRRFGDRVAEIVDGCSDTDETPKPPWEDRKKAHLDRLRHAGPSTLLVVAADKLHNARALLRQYRIQGEALWVQFRGGRKGTMWYFRAVVDLLKELADSPLAEELESAVAELEQLAG